VGHLVQDLSWQAPTNRHCSDCKELVDVLPTVNTVDKGSCRASTLVSAYVIKV
jgi:epoxyqueuosine reductase QueG